MHHWASEFNNSIPSSATDGMSSQASYKRCVSRFLSKVESSITQTTREVSSLTSCSEGGWTLKPVQIAWGSCPVKFWKPPRTDTSQHLCVTCWTFSSPQTEKYFVHTQLEVLLFQFMAAVFPDTSTGVGRLLWCPPVAISSPRPLFMYSSPQSSWWPLLETNQPVHVLFVCLLIGKHSAFSNASGSCPADCPPGALGPSQAERFPGQGVPSLSW